MNFWSPNIGRTGRVIRAASGSFLVTIGLVCLILGGPLWLSLLCWSGGLFCLVEAAGAWCIARACGIKTKW